MNYEQLREGTMLFARMDRLKAALEKQNPDEHIPAELKEKVYGYNTVAVIEDEIGRLEREFEKL